MDKDVVIELWKMVLPGRVEISKKRLTTFCTFVGSQTSSYSRLTCDQWTSFLDFCYECKDDFLTTYDESTYAWPVLIDEYVDYMMLEQQANAQKQTTKK